MSDSPTTPAPGVLIRALLADRAVRVLIVEAHGPAREAARRHDLSPAASQFTAEAMVAAALLSSHLKGDEQLTLQIQGSQPRLAIYVDQTADGRQRARTSPAHLPKTGPLSGAMLAIKSVDDREVYRGITEIEGSIERALSTHLGDSAQVDAVLRVHVACGDDGLVHSAAGLLLERLPPEADLPSISSEAFAERYSFLADADAAQLMTELAFGNLQGEALEILDSRPLVWQCRCSIERVRTSLSALGTDTLAEMIAEDGGAEVTCHFCNEVYHLDAAALEAIRQALAALPLA
jgi:molecular chaperone Hsp33